MPSHRDTELPFQRCFRYDRPGFGTEFDTEMNLDFVRPSPLARFPLKSPQGCFRDLPDISERIFKLYLRFMDGTSAEYPGRRPPIDLGLVCLDDDRSPVNVPPQEFTRQRRPSSMTDHTKCATAVVLGLMVQPFDGHAAVTAAPAASVRQTRRHAATITIGTDPRVITDDLRPGCCTPG
jgi:hypothetical protein